MCVKTFVVTSTLALVAAAGIVAFDSPSDRAGAVIGGATVAGGYDIGQAVVPDPDKMLFEPRGIALSSDGAIYVADSGAKRVVRWAPGASSGQEVAGGQYQIDFLDDVRLQRPTDVALAADGTLYVLDSFHRRIVRYEPGSHQAGIVVDQCHDGDDPSTCVVDPYSIGLDGSERVYISEPMANWVRRFDGISPAGEIVAGTGVAGADASSLDGPMGIDVDASGVVHVADSRNDRVQRWAPGASSGTTAAGGTNPGDLTKPLDDPEEIAVDSTGAVYVSDFLHHRVQKWKPGKHWGVTVAGTGVAGEEADQLSGPIGVAVDSYGNLFVADSGNDRVQKWVPGVQGLLVGDLEVAEGAPGTSQTATLTVRLRAPVTFAVCVWYSTRTGSAASGDGASGPSDFLSLGATKPRAKLLAAGATTTKIATKIYGDDTAEDDETFSVSIDRITATTNGVCANRDAMADLSQIARRSAKVTILDDDDPDRYYRPAT